MKINYALMSCDENPLYIDFIPVVTKSWNRLGIKPVFAIISENENKIIETENSLIYYFKKIENVKITHEALFARIWLWKELKGNCILSDIDMIPISSKYFNGIAEKYANHQIVSYCYDAVDRFGQIASCYILANSWVIGNLIIENDYISFIKNRSIELGEVWGADQVYLKNIIDSYSDTVKLNRGWNAGGEALNRLDRNTWKYNDDDILNENIYDSHLLRPYKKYQKEIDKLINLLT